MSGKRLSPDALNRLRKQAVSLRLQGKPLKEVSAETGLSAPTVIAAYKAFLGGGWMAVPVKARGRPTGSIKGRQASESEMEAALLASRPEELGPEHLLWSHQGLGQWLEQRYGIQATPRTVARYAKRWGYTPPDLDELARKVQAPTPQAWLGRTHPQLLARIQVENGELLWGGECALRRAGSATSLLYARSLREKLRWSTSKGPTTTAAVIDFLDRLVRELGKKVFFVFDGVDLRRFDDVRDWLHTHRNSIEVIPMAENKAAAVKAGKDQINTPPERDSRAAGDPMILTHLQRLEAESIHIMREVVAQADNPVMLYSIGKDSAVMLHLAMKAFYPAVPPFPLLHVDTGWKFRDMYLFRDRMAKELGMDLLVHINPEGVEKGINPFTHGSAIHTDVMKTEGLKQALNKYGFDAAFGGARRDEEKSRAKERVFSFRNAQHRWDPKNQRPELWKLYNTRKHKGESIRVFPLSNWTELDIWQYIYLENVPIVPLYLAAERPVVERDGTLIMVDDERMPLKPGEVPMMRRVRFRTLGCYPLTGAVESDADTLPAIIQEMLLTKTSERQGRVIDHDSAASMEKKKQEGYF